MMPADGKLLADLPGEAQPAEAPPEPQKARPANLTEIAIRLDTLRPNAPLTFPTAYHLRAWLIDHGITEAQIEGWGLYPDPEMARRQLAERRDRTAERAAHLAKDADEARKLRDRLDGILAMLQGSFPSGA